MSRLGPWLPGDAEERLDRMESLAEIRQLPMRYAVAIDSRNMDDLVALFVPDVRVGRDQSGRAALRAWFVDTLSKPKMSVHLVANHVIDFDDADHARGIVYCRDELGRPDGGWDYGMLQYWDTYARVDGEWCFHRRKFLRWYMVDALERPYHGAGVGADHDALTTNQLPEAFDSWARFWAEVGSDPFAR
jgi:SnoaL-like domain